MTPEQIAALDSMMAKEQPRIDRANAKAKQGRKRDEEMFQRHTKNYLDANFSYQGPNGEIQYVFPYWAVRNETPPPPVGMDAHDWAMRQGKRAKDMGIRAGVSDWHFLLHGKYRVIELKVPGGAISRGQKHYMADIVRHGGEVHVAWNMDEFHGIISSWMTVKYGPAAINTGSKKLLRQQIFMKEMYRRD